MKTRIIVILGLILTILSCAKKEEVWKYDLGKSLKVQTIPLYYNKKDAVVTWRIDTKKVEDKDSENKRYVVPKVNTFSGDISMKLQNKIFTAHLVAVDVKTGKEIWKTPTIGESDQNLSSPVSFDKFIYVGSDNGKLYEINGQNGKITFTYDTGSWIYTTPFVNKDYILAENEKGFLYLWDRKTKDLIFKKKIGYSEKKWYIINNYIYGYSKNTIYKINLDGKIEKTFQLKDKYVNFSKEEVPNAPIISRLLIRKNNIYFTARSGYLYKLNFKKSKIIWKTKVKVSFSSPVYYKGKIYLGTKKDLLSFSAKTGKKINRFKTDNSWIDFDIHFRKGGAVNGTAAVKNNTVYFGSYDYALYAYSLNNDKKIKWKYAIKHHIDRTKPIIIKDKYICFGADSHHLYLLRK